MPCSFEQTALWVETVAIIEPHRQQCDAAPNRSIHSAKEDRNQPGCLDSTPYHQRTTSTDNRHYDSHRRGTLTLVVDVPFRHPSFFEPARAHDRRTTTNAKCQNSRQRYLPTGPLEMPASLQQLRRPILGLLPLPAANWKTSQVGYGRWNPT